MSKLWVLFAAACLGLLLLAKLVFGPSEPALTIVSEQTSANASADAQIRRYILDHPEVLMESVQRLQSGATNKALVELRPQIETAFASAMAGNPNGDVTIVEFFDFRCPYCRMAHEQVKILIAQDNNIRVVYRDMPVLDRPGQEPLSRIASKIALAAAKQGKYKAFYDAVFANPGRISRETLVAIVRSLKLDETRIAKDMESDDIRKSLDSNIKLANSLGIDGTPGFIIGEQLFMGAQGVDELKAAVKRVRDAAKG
jgi:protein-disulfide isomerase